jgi:hypothetical protein
MSELVKIHVEISDYLAITYSSFHWTDKLGCTLNRTMVR